MRWHLRGATPWLAASVLGGCIVIEEGVIVPKDTSQRDGGVLVIVVDGAPPPLDGSLPPVPPHSVRDVEPPHGPFVGGQQAIVRGSGFTSQARVWFGATEVPAADVLPVDSGRIQVVVPAGPAGLVDVSTQNGDDASTYSTARQAYVYDALYLTPSSGPRSGGTVVVLHGSGTTWDSTSSVSIDGQPCTVLEVRSPAGAPQEIECRTPPGTPGAKRVTVTTGDARDEVLDAFVYGDSDNGFRGGLSGDALGNSLDVLVLNSFTRRALGGATVVAGSDVTTTSDLGAATLTGALGPTRTVTVAAKCFQPVTFVDVPVDTVTVYLDPILSPSCWPEGTPIVVGSGGGGTVSLSHVRGELVWPPGAEFQRGDWTVPLPASPDARRAAYVFQFASDANRTFRLPAPTTAVTPDAAGDIGYAFEVTTGYGSVALYALAGIEDRTVTPPLFTAYSMGFMTGLTLQPGQSLEDVFIPMNMPLDHSLSLTIVGPTPTAVGPDRVTAQVGVRVGGFGYATLPVGPKVATLPVAMPLSFVGLPAIGSGGSGLNYVLSARAATGESGSVPSSFAGLFSTTAMDTSVTLSGFLEIPVLTTPATGATWNGRDLAITTAPGGPEPELTLFEIQSGNGLSTWTIVAPKGVTSVALPDLASLGSVGLGAGPVSIQVTRARIGGFDYGSLRYRDLGESGWDAAATNVFPSHL